jgi:hypothetical protein
MLYQYLAQWQKPAVWKTATLKQTRLQHRTGEHISKNLYELSQLHPIVHFMTDIRLLGMMHKTDWLHGKKNRVFKTHYS